MILTYVGDQSNYSSGCGEMKKISCIIPALNEERQIAKVLDAVLAAKRKISMEIIVIDDGSTDQTPTILSRYKNIRVITNKRNRGKSYSIAKGFEMSTGDYILLLDADLVGLTANNILELLSPIENGTADTTMSIMKNAFILMRKIRLDYLSGIRIFPRDLIAPHVDDIKTLPNFALEVYLNNLMIQYGYSIATVHWSNVANHYKYRKRGFYAGLRAELKMFSDILGVVPATGLVRHNLALRKLLVKNDT